MQNRGRERERVQATKKTSIRFINFAILKIMKNAQNTKKNCIRNV